MAQRGGQTNVRMYGQEIYPFYRPSWLGLRPGWLCLRPGWLGLRPGWMAQRGERTDGWTDKRMENLPILQDFVPYWGHCPVSPHENHGASRAGRSFVHPSVPPSGPSSQACRPAVRLAIRPSIHPSLRPSLRPSVRPSLRPSICPVFFLKTVDLSNSK